MTASVAKQKIQLLRTGLVSSVSKSVRRSTREIRRERGKKKKKKRGKKKSKQFETTMTTNVLKQDPHTSKSQKNAIY